MSDYLIHNNAIVETKNIGKGSRIWAFVHILKNAIIGENANICDHCFIENKVVIGNDVTIKCGVYLWDGINIEDKVFIGPSVAFTNDIFPRSKNNEYKQETIRIKKGASIGANSTILGGVTIGEYAMIGAGSVVTKNVPDYTLYFGTPAMFKSYICACTKKMIFTGNNYTCSCDRQYEKVNERIVSIK